MKRINYNSPVLRNRLARFYDLTNQNLTDEQAEAKIRELIREAQEALELEAAEIPVKVPVNRRKGNAENYGSGTLACMPKFGLPLTRETWLALNGLTEDTVDPETESMMPPFLQRDYLDEIEPEGGIQ